MSDTNTERQRAVREAWKREKTLVRDGNGTRDWSQAEQKEIVAKGKATGYEGHHMKSVKEYPQHAGNPDNIQFLNRSEHIDGAHKGNTQNSTNGYYNPQTKQMSQFGNRNPKSLPSQKLSQPLTQRQQNLSIKIEQVRKQAAKQAKLEAKQSVSKTNTTESSGKSSVCSSNTTELHSGQQSSATPPNKVSENKGISKMKAQVDKASFSLKHTESKSGSKGLESFRQKAATKDSSLSSSNKGITSYQSKANGPSSATTTKSTSTSATKNSSSSQSNSAGQRR